MREPQPPSFKVQPGRPKSKKRKLEPGECSIAGGQPSTTLRKKQCSHCKGFGHYAKTCKLPAAPDTDVTKLAGRPPLNTPLDGGGEEEERNRAAKKSAIGGRNKQHRKQKVSQEQEGCLPLNKQAQL
ncbi:uncharacterized protein LOC110739197 [Chenopodium quinoa]|uniref:uncharacterized protein LOC110739197 n=1 Tax=Chenopodium quinoa TaxID=63459 RepID=UPI000B77B5ED|nr:uncharacterized protein LOC110739197 [Chenopodium quinoa]